MDGILIEYPIDENRYNNGECSAISRDPQHFITVPLSGIASIRPAKPSHIQDLFEIEYNYRPRILGQEIRPAPSNRHARNLEITVVPVKSVSPSDS